jgi:hypothetical protein
LTAQLDFFQDILSLAPGERWGNSWAGFNSGTVEPWNKLALVWPAGATASQIREGEFVSINGRW